MEEKHLIGLLCAIASAATTIINSGSVMHIYKTYDLSQCLFHILTIDSSIASIFSVITVGNGIYQVFQEEPSPISCTISTLIGVSSVTQAILSGLISLIRYKRIALNSPNGWKPEPELIKVANWTLFGSILFYVTFLSINATLDFGMSPVYNACIWGNDAKPLTPGLIVVFIPSLFGVLSSAILDFKSWRTLKERHGNLEHCIPFRATIISTCLSVPYFIFSAVLAVTHIFVKLEPLTLSAFALVLAYLVVLLKNPLILTFAFQVNHSIQYVNSEEDRERRRQIEIQDALKAREKRRAERRKEENVEQKATFHQKPINHDSKRNALTLPDVSC